MLRATAMECVHLGANVVRVAYVTKKTRLAESLGLGVPSPNDGSILNTHDRYPGCDAFIL
jgi:hypothetical protein